ncbi:hypothetical protein OG230_16800 [Streptomyces sp. NBC_00234]|uniref:hypothetical protein n=1 Tax=Streptomyces sp. NBC_00234 TaxID=2903638 RepID=UPI002E2CE77C|nr:hypothetical protein [Streptomyces sp. NBC_00234]
MSKGSLGEWSGWSDRAISIPGGNAGVPTPLEIHGGFTSSFEVQPTSSRAGNEDLALDAVTTYRRERCRIVLPAAADSFTIRRIRFHERAGGIHRWHARILAPETFPTLPRQDLTGSGTETYFYVPEPRYYGDVRVLRYAFEDYGNVMYNPADGGEPTRILTSHATREGVLRLPHRGYVTLSSDGGWQASAI